MSSPTVEDRWEEPNWNGMYLRDLRTIHHKPGVKNQNADALSRRPYEQPTPEIMAFNCENSTVYTKVELFYENSSSIPYVPCVFAADTAESQPINQLIPFQKKQMMWTLFHLSIQAFFEN